MRLFLSLLDLTYAGALARSHSLLKFSYFVADLSFDDFILDLTLLLAFLLLYLLGSMCFDFAPEYDSAFSDDDDDEYEVDDDDTVLAKFTEINWQFSPTEMADALDVFTGLISVIDVPLVDVALLDE